MKKKSLVLLLSATMALGVGTSVVLSLNREGFYNAKADKTFDCSLPTGFYEIEDVIEQAITNSDTPTLLDKPFRGTVTAINNNYAYVQRKNQLNGLIDGIRIKGIDSYASSLEVNNVIDVTGGYLYLCYGEPTLELYGDDQLEIIFNENPYGFAPTEYNNFEDYFANGFRNPSVRQYDASKLVKISNVTVSGSDISSGWGADEVFDCETMNRVYASYDAGYETFGLYIYVRSYQDPYTYRNYETWEKLVYAAGNEIPVNITGYLVTDTYSGNAFHIVDPNAVEFELDYDSTLFDSREIYTAYWDESFSPYYPRSTVYYPIGSDIPYVNFREFFNDLYAPYAYNDSWGNSLSLNSHSAVATTYYSNNSENLIVLSPTAETIEMESIEFLPIDNFWLFGPEGQHYLVDGIETDFCQVDWTISRSKDTALVPTIYTKTIDLSDYNIDIIQDSTGDAYIPFQIADALLWGTNGYSWAFNGKDAYFSVYIDSTSEFFWKHLIDTPWYNQATMGSQAYCDYAFDALCFTLDYAYGLIDENMGGNARTFIESTGFASDLKSTDRLTYEAALQKFLALHFYDGHAGYGYRSPKTDDVSLEEEQTYNYWRNFNPRRQQLRDTYNELQSYRDKAELGVGLRIYENMAVLTFDQFMKYDGDSTAYDYSQDYATVHNDGSDLLFRKAFNEIEDHGGIDYIVIDDAMNGGGMVDAIPFLTAYFTLDPSLTNRNSLTGEVVDIHYQVDLNQNGVFGEATDTYANRGYEFYWLTSRYSFSCGNVMPTIIKGNNLDVTLIGQRSGGGECIVGYLSTAHGATLRSSSVIHGGYWESGAFVGNEDGIPVDYTLTYDKYYNNAELLAFLNSISI